MVELIRWRHSVAVRNCWEGVARSSSSSSNHRYHYPVGPVLVLVGTLASLTVAITIGQRRAIKARH